jgi:DNA-binding beta-propeller fold protein YncE
MRDSSRFARAIQTGWHSDGIGLRLSGAGAKGNTNMSRRSLRLLGLGLLAAVGLAAASTHAAPTYALVDRVKIPDGGFDYASYDPVHHRLYVSRTGGVTAMDVDTKAVTTLDPQAQRTHESLILNHGANLLVTDSGTNSAHVLNALTGASLAEIPTGKKPDAAIFDPATGLALVMNGASGDVTLVDPKTWKAVGAITIGGALEFGAADGAGKAFVNVEDQNLIAVIDTKARKVIARYPLAGCKGPSGLAYAADAGVLIAACGNNVGKVINAATGADIATLAIGRFPDAVIYDPVRKLAFIPCAFEGVLEVIAVRGPTDVSIIQTVKTQQGARLGAVDLKSGRIYLPTAKYAMTDGRPTPTPGTFEILVVAPN